MIPEQTNNYSLNLAAKAKWPLFLIANIAILFVVGMSTVRETYRGWSVDREIKALESEAMALEGRRSELAAFAEKIQSTQYLERESRAKLNLQKPGEHVIILEGVSPADAEWSSIDITPEPPVMADTRSNPERWWDYFTKPAI